MAKHDGASCVRCECGYDTRSRSFCSNCTLLFEALCSIIKYSTPSFISLGILASHRYRTSSPPLTGPRTSRSSGARPGSTLFPSKENVLDESLCDGRDDHEPNPTRDVLGHIGDLLACFDVCFGAFRTIKHLSAYRSSVGEVIR